MKVSTKNLLVTATVVVFAACFLSGCGDSVLDGGDETAGEEVFSVFTAGDGLADDTVTDVVVDNIRKGVWVATLNGISFYSSVDSSWTTYGAEYDIPNMEVTSLALDYLTGRVWAGTVSGPAYFEDGDWSAMADIDSLVHRYVTAIAPLTDGSIWFGTKGGLCRRDYMHAWTSYTALSQLAGNNVTTLAVGAFNELWIGTTNGISVFDGKEWKLYGASVLPSLYINVIYRQSNGVVWCGTMNGVVSFDGAGWSEYGVADGVPSPVINDIVEDRDGVMWIATDGGVAGFADGEWKKLNLPEEVANERMLCIASDVVNGILWIGTTRGVVRYEVRKGV